MILYLTWYIIVSDCIWELPKYVSWNIKSWYEHKSKKRKTWFLKFIHNTAFGKTIENVRKQRDVKLVTTERRRNYLVSGPNYCTTKLLSKNLLVIEMRKTQILMNKLVYLGLSILELSKSFSMSLNMIM